MRTPPYISQQPVDDFGLNFTNLLYSATLAASTEETLTIPGSAPRFKALMKVKETGEVWVALNGTAAVPEGATFAATTSEMINETLCREVKAGDVLHFITATASTDISVVLYALGTTN